MTTESWERLLTHLATFGAVTEEAEGGVRLALGDRTVTVLVTPDDWDDIPVVWGTDDEGALLGVTRAIEALGPDDRFLVYENYELHPSPTEQTPGALEDEELAARVAEARRRDPGATFGWYVERPDGTRDWFRDMSD
ncbi:hypothetical protein ACT8ZV_17285 [Nocardioides sp. MAHUQ-72]|uniref:hypothetical protein n=1 Tax=unclassified Nocardioides TaxID=2615069 RepID=UPI003623C01F